MILLRKTTLITLLFCLLLNSLSAQQVHSDNGDGTFTNPVISGDFPDPDVIFVDSVYYMVSTTMFIFPGVTILKSYDLVNWEYCSNAVPRFDFGSCYNLDGCDRYAHGQWATSLKYNKGTFYLLFITLNEGGFLCSTKNPEGPWNVTHLPRGFYDPGLFFDDDGKIYVAHGYSTINITELDTNFTAISSDSLVFTGDIRAGLEGSHVYKINGYYYLYCTYGGGNGMQVALRSDNIYGPYEERIVINDVTNSASPTYGVHQGALIQTQTGEWWTMLFRDEGAFGRFPSLQPITWVDDFPVAGVDGKGVVTYTKPDIGKTYPATTLPTSDEFDDVNLGMQWGWNHNPDSTKWSLTDNPGFLRLYTAKITDTLTGAVNSLTQRLFSYYSDDVSSNGIVKININNMLDGDIAGLALFQDPYAFIGIKKADGKTYAIMVNNGAMIDSVELSSSTVYLRAHAMYGTSKATFAYSTDNKIYHMLGNELLMQFKLTVFTGNKFMLFNFATKALGGYVDIDWFRTEVCEKTLVETSLRVNDGAIEDTNRATIYIGDSVWLKPNASAEGTWQWTGCNLSSSDSAITVYPEKYCQTSVTFINACGMSSSAKFSIIVNKPTAFENYESEFNLKVYPNPSHSSFCISAESLFNKVAIYCMEGKVLFEKTYETPLNNVELNPGLKSGLYLLKIFNSTKSATLKLVLN